MDIEFQNTKTDYTNFYRFYFKDSFQKRFFKLLFVPLVIGYLSGGKPIDWTRFFWGIIFGLLLLAIIYFIPYWLSLKKMNKVIASDPGYLGSKKLSTTDEGLYFETSTRNGTWKWESIHSVYSTIDFIYIVFADKRILLIPGRAFLSNIDFSNFLGTIQSRINKVQAVSKVFSTANKYNKPPYLLGLLCLIPLIGGFVGIALILYGIFKYKNRLIVIIGIAGLAFTVIVYSSLFYKMKYGHKAGKGFAQISQMQLNTLMKDIEFYKMEKGTYPDNLEQICGKNSITWIYDPLQIRKGKKKDLKFNYLKIGDKYYLFSSGIDGIPNTPDDIYPTIADEDSSKFGLIRMRNK